MDSTIKKTDSPSIIFFDDDCLVCNGFVQFVLRQDDGRGAFRFASLSSSNGQDIAQQVAEKIGPEKETLVLREHGQVYTQSTALLKIFRKLGGLWLLCYPLILLPARLRDLGYDLFSRNRYRFGKAKTSCVLLSPEQREYFIS